MNLYDILGLRKDASEAEIRKAGKKAQQKAHPDRGGDEEQFKKIGQALAVLSDPVKRAEYDAGESKERIFTDEEQAAIVLPKMFIYLAEREEGDILNACRREIRKGMQEGPMAIAAHKRKMARIEKILNKHLKSHCKNIDHLGDALAKHLAELTKTLMSMEMSMRIGPTMLKMLDSYNWIPDAPQYMYNDMFIFGSSILDSKGP